MEVFALFLHIDALTCSSVCLHFLFMLSFVLSFFNLAFSFFFCSRAFILFCDIR